MARCSASTPVPACSENPAYCATPFLGSASTCAGTVCKENTFCPARGPTATRYVIEWPSKSSIDRYVAAFETIVETLSRMHEAGILLLPGTDMGGWFTYHRELELSESLGMTPAEVLRRATHDMAVHLGQDEDLGSIAKGKYADFFLVPGTRRPA